METIFTFICLAAVVITAIICIYNHKNKLAELNIKSEENSYRRDVLEIKSIIQTMRLSCVQQTKESLEDIVDEISGIVN